jgi:hypothetical protein
VRPNMTIFKASPSCVKPSHPAFDFPVGDMKGYGLKVRTEMAVTGPSCFDASQLCDAASRIGWKVNSRGNLIATQSGEHVPTEETTDISRYFNSI